MSSGPESALFKNVKKKLVDALVVPLENRVNLGIPDCLIATPPTYSMLELKVVKTGKKVRLSPHQIAFALKHGSMGMPTYILVQWHPKGTTKASETRLLLYHGTQAQELHERGVDTLPVAQWALNAVDWDELERQIAISGRIWPREPL